MTTLVLSPHLDDAVLSLGGAIAAWTAAGERVVIATVYTAGPPLAEVAPEMHVFADYATRLAEDDAACATLGAEVVRLGLVERAFRPPFLTDFAYFTTPAERAGLALAPVRAALDAVALDAARIVIPLGVGNHVDHVATLVAGTDWALARGLADQLWFYEDFYALAGALRSCHRVTRARMWSAAQAPLRRAPELAAVLHAIAAKRRGPDPTRLLAHALRDATWTVEAAPIREAAKLAAITCYASQETAFGGHAGIAAALCAYHAWWGDAEPLWRGR